MNGAALNRMKRQQTKLTRKYRPVRDGSGQRLAKVIQDRMAKGDKTWLI